MSTGNGGPLSPDKRHQWNGTEWVPVPKPPQSTSDMWFDTFKAACIIGLALLVLGVLISVLGS